MSILRLIRLGFSGFSGRQFCLIFFCGLFAASFSLPALGAAIQDAAKRTPAIAWDVNGAWRVQERHEFLRAGDAIEPGSLLEPDEEDSAHSITILLPDGQRILYECFTAKDCARGFRVPDLYRDPTRFAARMMERIQAALVKQRSQPQLAPPRRSRAGRDELAAVLGPQNRIELSGLAESLSNGRYVYDLTPIHAPYPPQAGISFQKSGRVIAIKVPGPGLYSLRIIDPLKNPRINYLIAVVRRAEEKKVVDAFHEAQSLIEDWNGDYQGWPIHDFQRACLEALMLNIPPAANTLRKTQASIRAGSDITAEPLFSPRPGVFSGDTPVTLHSASPGAVIHYTFDASQPFESSPVYRAPIMVKGTELTIKAFAESPGKKDSAVVTGIFRIANP